MSDSTTAPLPAAVRWQGGSLGHLVLLDQTRLPLEVTFLSVFDIETLFEAIRALRVRGAPAIGIAAAYGICLGLQPLFAPALGANRVQSDNGQPDSAVFFERLEQVRSYLAASRPTAVNLFWALDRMVARARQLSARSEPSAIFESLFAEACAIHREDVATCRAIGRHGAELLPDGASVLTHCNAGGLATAEYGTALSIFFTAQDQGKRLHVFVDETRPLLQGARLTAWELMQRGLDATLICDSMAGQVMREGRVQGVFTGADRIAANGDAANKIGTYSLAVLARAHRVPFYVAAPRSTFDFNLPDGSQIPIELRDAEEVAEIRGHRVAPVGMRVYNPAFDVTPAEWITGIITEYGVIQPVTADQIARVMLTEEVRSG